MYLCDFVTEKGKASLLKSRFENMAQEKKKAAEVSIWKALSNLHHHKNVINFRPHRPLLLRKSHGRLSTKLLTDSNRHRLLHLLNSPVHHNRL